MLQVVWLWCSIVPPVRVWLPMNNRTGLLVAIVLLLHAAPLCAKRASDHVSPPYLERVARSAAGLSPIGAILAAVSIVSMRPFSSVSEGKRRKFLAGVVLLILLGSVVAALDSLNDELWNPGLWGSPFLAAIPFLAILNLLPNLIVWKRLSLGVAFAIPTWLFAVVACFEWQYWGREHGLPTFW
jgi:hypothetical protein